MVWIIKTAGRRQAAGGRRRGWRQAAGGRRQAAGLAARRTRSRAGVHAVQASDTAVDRAGSLKLAMVRTDGRALRWANGERRYSGRVGGLASVIFIECNFHVREERTSSGKKRVRVPVRVRTHAHMCVCAGAYMRTCARALTSVCMSQTRMQT